METLRRVINKINEQLADLTASQRLAIGLCAVVIFGSFLWLVQWSVEPEYVRLLEEPMTTEQLAAVREQLPAGSFKIVGDAVWVPPAERHNIFWQLQSVGALPADTSITFARLIEDDSPFRPESENQFRRRVALQNELAMVIASSPRVRSAEVFITDTSSRRINAPNVIPKASIKLMLVSGYTLDPETVKACAAMAAGAVPGLLPHNVSVIDGATLRSYAVPNPEDAFAQGQLQEKKKHEDHLRKKVQDQLSYIPGVRVSVSVQLDPARKQTREMAYAPPAVAEEQTRSTDSQTGAAAGEPGVGPNVGQALAGGSNAGRDTIEESTTKFQDQPLSREVTTQHPAFAVLRTTASIGIPHSYVVGLLKIAGDDDPSAAQIKQQFSIQQRSIRDAVRNIIMADNDDEVTVSLYHDLEPAVTVGPDGMIAAAPSLMGELDVPNMLRSYGPQAGLALLALAGLFLLTRMARKSAYDAAQYYASREQKKKPDEELPEEVFTVGPGPVGMAVAGEDGMLEAREVDDDVLRAEQLTAQVSQLVDDDPVSVANMLRRWTEASP